MGLVTILSNLLRALAAYWEIKSKRYEHDIREHSRERLEALEDQLNEFRDRGTPIDSHVADRLLSRILTEKAYFESLPNPSASDRSRDGD